MKWRKKQTKRFRRCETKSDQGPIRKPTSKGSRDGEKKFLRLEEDAVKERKD